MYDGSLVLGASKGAIEGSGIGGLGVGTLLQDLREAYLHNYGGLEENERDTSAKWFDTQLEAMATKAQQLDSADQ